MDLSSDESETEDYEKVHIENLSGIQTPAKPTKDAASSVTTCKTLLSLWGYVNGMESTPSAYKGMDVVKETNSEDCGADESESDMINESEVAPSQQTKDGSKKKWATPKVKRK